MDSLSSINSALAFTNLLVNFFFCYCLAFSPKTIKQPLKILMELMISCSIVFLIPMSIKIFFDRYGNNFALDLIVYIMSYCSLTTSLMSSVWLNFFYYTQIVPAKSYFSIWLKRNVKSVIYGSILFERLWLLTDMTMDILRGHAVLSFRMQNTTIFQMLYQEGVSVQELDSVDTFYSYLMWFFRLYFIWSVGVMLMSNISIMCYLIRHIKSMSTNGLCLSCPMVQRQLRVAVSGVLQVVLYIICASWIAQSLINNQTSFYFPNFFSFFTVINVYMLCTSLNMWAGQAVFRQRTVDIIRAWRGKSRGGDSPRLGDKQRSLGVQNKTNS